MDLAQILYVDIACYKLQNGIFGLLFGYW